MFSLCSIQACAALHAASGRVGFVSSHRGSDVGPTGSSSPYPEGKESGFPHLAGSTSRRASEAQ